MPKIIENLEFQLSEEARRQIRQAGYGAMTIRSVAAACGVGVGTVYNYFPSKDALTASFMLRDWRHTMEGIARSCGAGNTPREAAWSIYSGLQAFCREHQTLFQDAAAQAGFASSMGKYHTMLRQELAQLLCPFCCNAFRREFVAEALICWTLENQTFEILFDTLSPLLNEKER